MPRKKKEGQESQPAAVRVKDELAQEGSGEPESVPAEVPAPPSPIEVQVGKLREALALVAPAVPRKPTLPALTNIRLGDGRAVATDLEVAVGVDLAEAQEPMLLPAREALEFLNYAPGHLPARLSQERKTLTIAVGDMETRFSVPAPEEFPPVPFTADLPNEGVLNGEALVRAMAEVLPCAAVSDSRPVLNSVCLTLGDALEVATADGFRLAWEPVPGRLAGEGQLIIPGNGVRLLERLWKQAAVPELGGVTDLAGLAIAKRLVRLQWGNGRLMMRFGVVTLLVQLISGSFPNYRQLIPSGEGPTFTVDAEEMARALKQVSRVAQEGSGVVRLVWAEDGLQVSARAEEKGETTVRVRVSGATPGKVAANIGYLLDYFGDRTGPVTVAAKDHKSPLLFTYRGRPHLTMMPMFVQW